MSVFSFIGPVLLAAYFVMKWLEKRPARTRRASPGERLARQNELWNELLCAVGGDKAKATRLIEYERKLDPGLKTLEAIDRAAERLCGDRGRVLRK